MESPSLRPVTGGPTEVMALLEPWLATDDPPALVVRTSGSSGRPKDVVLSRRAVVASATATHARLGGPGQWLLDLPPQYVAGLQALTRSVLAGASPVLAADHESLAAATAAMTGPRRYAALVPTQLHRLHVAGDLGVLAALDAVLVGGAAMPAGLAAAARVAGVRVVRTYGMSETAGGCVYDGLPLDGIGVRVDAGRTVWLTGPVLFDGYDGDPAATAAVLQDGWFETSDLGELDADGRLRVLGRGDDVVVSGGVNVGLPAVGEALRGCAGVVDAVAVGVDDAEWGTRVVAVIVGARGPDLAALRDGVEAAGLPRTWAPRSLVVVDRLPLLANGKLDRLAVRAQAMSTDG